MSSARICPRCQQPYHGAFHKQCPGKPGVAPAVAPTPAVSSEPPLFVLTQDAPPPQPIPFIEASAPQPADASLLPSPVQASGPGGNTPFGAPGRTELHAARVTATPARPALPVPPAPQPVTPSALPSPARGRRDRLCTIISRHQEQMRRPANNPAIMALVGALLIVFNLLAYAPCLALLILLGCFMIRGQLLRIIFPGGQVMAWHFEVYDHDLGATSSVMIIDPVGVAPGERWQVRVRGRDRRHYFQATEIIRERDPNGLPVHNRDGLVARQVPPAWLGMLVLGAGLLLMGLNWI